MRRLTGGRSLLHEDELTYSVVVGERYFGGVRQAYSAINRILVTGLRSLGAPVELCDAGGARPPTPSNVPCFAEPVSGEVLGGGRKLIGSAQVRSGRVLLQHGSLPLRRGPAARQLFGVIGGAEGVPAYLDRLVGEPVPWEKLTAALSAAWAQSLGEPIPALPAEPELQRANALLARYQAAEWTWRR